MNTTKILRDIASKNGTTVAEVRREIQSALDIGMQNPDPLVQAYWNRIPRRGKKPTVEEVLTFLAKQVK
ncbi:MAG: sporulation initiation factor Spo0A C-terminal domain-containing protein [Oscillospiraceae bacterium]